MDESAQREHSHLSFSDTQSNILTFRKSNGIPMFLSLKKFTGSLFLNKNHNRQLIFSPFYSCIFP